MKLKSLAIAVAILAVLSAIAYWYNRPPPPPAADPRVGLPLADAGAIGRATQLRVSDQGKTVELKRQSDGSWRVSSYYDLPADFSKLSGFTGDLTTAKIQRLVTTSPDRIARLEFNDTKIEFLDDSGQPLWAVILGKSPDAGGRFVRFGDEPRAYLADLNSQIDSDGKNWADAALLSLKPEDIARVEIPFDTGGSVVASRAKPDSPWTSDKTPAGKRVKADSVSSLLTSLGALRFSDTSDPADPQAAAAKRHLRTFVFTTFDGKTYTVALGRKPEEKKPKPSVSTAAAGTPAAGAPPASSAPASSSSTPSTTPADDTTPAGPVYAFVSSSDPKAPVNALMEKRAFQVDDYIFTSLPQKPDDLFEPAPAPASPPSPSDKPKS